MPELELTSKRKKPEQPKKRTPKRRKKMGPVESFLSGVLPWRGDSAGEAARKIILLVSTIVLFAAGFIMLNFYVFRDQQNTQEVQSYVEQKKSNDSDQRITILMDDADEENASNGDSQKEVEILAEYQTFYDTNKDFVGWIEMYPYIQMPVVQTDNNEYYLHHTFEGYPNDNGTIFADYQGKITATEKTRQTD